MREEAGSYSYVLACLAHDENLIGLYRVNDNFEKEELLLLLRPCEIGLLCKAVFDYQKRIKEEELTNRLKYEGYTIISIFGLLIARKHDDKKAKVLVFKDNVLIREMSYEEWKDEISFLANIDYKEAELVKKDWEWRKQKVEEYNKLNRDE